MKVASQDAQCNVTFQAKFGMVAAAFQSISRLECADRGFHTRMALTRLSERNRCCAFLLRRLLDARHGEARLVNDVGEQALILRRVTPTIERDSLKSYR